MCDPATAIAAASFAIGTGSAVAGYSAQKAQGEQQEIYTSRVASASQEAAVRDYANQSLRIQQESDAAINEKEENQIAATKARGRAITAAGESHVSGLSVDALLQDFYGQEGRFNSAVDRNFQISSDYARAEMDSTQAQAQGRINAVDPVIKPSFADAALRIAGSGVSSYQGYRDNTRVS